MRLNQNLINYNHFESQGIEIRFPHKEDHSLPGEVETILHIVIIESDHEEGEFISSIFLALISKDLYK